VTLPAFAVARRRLLHGLSAAAIERYILPAVAADVDRKAAAIGQTDGPTPDRYIDPAPHTIAAVPITCEPKQQTFVTVGDDWLIRQTLSNSLLWSLVFYRGCLAPSPAATALPLICKNFRLNGRQVKQSVWPFFVCCSRMSKKINIKNSNKNSLLTTAFC